MVSARIYWEGGGNTKEGRARCREGFRKLIENSGFAGRMPRLVACGSRISAFDDFKTAHAQRTPEAYVGLLVDSEDPVVDIDRSWHHVQQRIGDQWVKPNGAVDEQLLFMITSMETWIVTDRDALSKHFGPRFNAATLPPLQGIEQRERQAMLNALQQATADCPGPYAKGAKSFGLLAKLDPDVLEQHLPSFTRARLILDQNL